MGSTYLSCTYRYSKMILWKICWSCYQSSAILPDISLCHLVWTCEALCALETSYSKPKSITSFLSGCWKWSTIIIFSSFRYACKIPLLLGNHGFTSNSKPGWQYCEKVNYTVVVNISECLTRSTAWIVVYKLLTLQWTRNNNTTLLSFFGNS